MAEVMFYIGLVLSLFVSVTSFFSSGDDKRAATLSPFMFFAAAFVAHTIGI